jgi:hypothetical protein
MKKILLLLCIEAFSSPLSAQECPLLYRTTRLPIKSGFVESLWEEEMERYKKIIEQRFGVFFDTLWRPRVSFSKTFSYGARYDQRTHSFLITHVYYSRLPREYGSIFIAELIGHLLGHALMEQKSYRTFCKPWPDTTLWKYGTEKQRFVQSLLSEGCAEYVASLFSHDTTTTLLVLPKRKKEYIWKSARQKERGGYALVKPIIDSFGVRGIDYIIENTFFPGKNTNLQKGARAYQARAFAILSKQANQ